ncbi:flippase-like domain-containing protein [Candidatus Microgenomates bacterium]|nr:flippase-like domain-containing protein [Candidatus Microgenomates bacterium]
MVGKGVKTLSLLSFLLGFFLLIVIVSLIEPAEILSSLRGITVWQFLAILILKLAFGILGALKWRITLNFYRYDVSLLKLYLFKLASFAVEYFTQVIVIGGQVSGVVLLRGERVPIKVGVAAMAIDSVTTSLVTITISFVAATTFLLTRFSSGPVATLVLLVFTILFLFIFALLAVTRIKPPIKRKSKASWWGRVETSIHELVLTFSEFFRYNKRRVVYLIALSLLGHTGVLLEIFLILLFLGSTVGVIDAAIIETGYTFAFLTPISQALGTAEAAGAFTLSLLGYSAALGVSLTLILRARHFLVGLLGIGVLLWYGVIKLPKITSHERF